MKYLILLSLLSCSIIRIVDLGKFNQEVRSNFSLLEKADSSIKKDIESFDALKVQWDKYGGDGKFNADLLTLKTQAEKINTALTFNRQAFEAHKLSKQKKKVTSEDKNYDEIEPYQKSLAGGFDVISKDLKTYQKSSNNLKAYLYDMKVYQVNEVKVQTDFSLALVEADNNYLRVKTELLTYEQKSGKKLPELKAALEGINSEVQGIRKLFEVVSAELKGLTSPYVVPGMKAHGYIDAIQVHGKVINGKIEEFNRLAKAQK